MPPRGEEGKPHQLFFSLKPAINQKTKFKKDQPSNLRDLCGHAVSTSSLG